MHIFTSHITSGFASTAPEIKTIPHDYPSSRTVTVEKNGNISFDCSANQPIQWILHNSSYFPRKIAWEANEFNLYSMLPKFIEGKFNISDDNNAADGTRYKSTLNLYNVNCEAVGLYICAYKSMEFYNFYEQIYRKSSDDVHLFVKGITYHLLFEMHQCSLKFLFQMKRIL